MAHRGRSGGKTRYEWLAGTGEAPALIAAAVVGFSFGVADQSETIMRVRGMVHARIDTSTIAVNDSCLVSWGLVVVPNGTVAGGITISPFSNGDADWLAYGLIMLGSETGAASDSEGSQTKHFEVDSKAMRRMRETQELAFVFENTDIAGAPSVTAGFALRVLTGE